MPPEITINLSASDLDALAERIAERLAERLRAINGPATPSTPSTPPAPPPPPKLHYAEHEAAEQLGVAAVTLKKWRQAGLVHSHTCSRPILYRQADLEKISRQMAAGQLTAKLSQHRHDAQDEAA